MPQSIINNGQQKMEKTIESLKKELQSVKTGRANPAVLNKVEVVYYGSPMPLNQLATISTPEAQILMIKPFDKNILKDIEKAILVADLNLTPQSDGSVIRIVFPPLTEQTRKQLGVMDLTAATLCSENNIDILVFDMNVKGNIKKAAIDPSIGTLVTSK
jgi:ribosome recycling factor